MRVARWNVRHGTAHDMRPGPRDSQRPIHYGGTHIFEYILENACDNTEKSRMRKEGHRPKKKKKTEEANKLNQEQPTEAIPLRLLSLRR